MGLGLDEDRLWSLTPRQYGALERQWERHQRGSIEMIAVLRADIHNGWMPRKDGRAWTAQEFGGGGAAPKRRDLRKRWTPEEFQQRVVSQFGPDGKGVRVDAPGSALAKLRGKGQPIPMPKRA